MMRFILTVFLSLCLWSSTLPTTHGSATCPQGPPGTNGSPGIPGIPGTTGLSGGAGRDGRDGRDAKGTKGGKGEAGLQGGTGPAFHLNWKHCVWKKDEGKDSGLIQECVFKKKHDNTALRVYYEGNLRVYGCADCCSRWYFTFNGAECRGPMTIEGLYYLPSNLNLHRHRHIEGYCTNIPRGTVRVGFWVGTCAGKTPSDAHTGWNSVSRIGIEEISPPQS